MGGWLKTRKKETHMYYTNKMLEIISSLTEMDEAAAVAMLLGDLEESEVSFD